MNPSKKILYQISLERHVKDIFYIALGVSMASIGLKGLLFPNNFLDGGAMGVSLLIKIYTNIDLSLLIVFINLPFILIGAKQISIEFAIKSILAIFCLALAVHFISLPQITNDKLLISIFGGFFLGSGIGLTIRGGAVIDGTEVLAITVSRKSSLSVGDFISAFNVVLFCLSLFLVGVETAMYSMLTYLAASKTVDFVINGIEEYIGIIIVSEKAVKIKKHIAINLGRGVTTLKSDTSFGSRGVSGSEGLVLFCVITRLEISKFLLEIEKIDSNAFIVQHSINDTKGGKIKRRPLH